MGDTWVGQPKEILEQPWTIPFFSPPDQAMLFYILKLSQPTPLQGSEVQTDITALDIRAGTAGTKYTVLCSEGETGCHAAAPNHHS